MFKKIAKVVSLVLVVAILPATSAEGLVVLGGGQSNRSQYCGWINITNGPRPVFGYTIDTTFELSANVARGSDQGLIGSSTSGFNAIIVGGSGNNKQLDVTLGDVTGTHRFYFPSAGTNAGQLNTQTLYTVSISIDSGGSMRAWLNGVGMQTTGMGSGSYVQTVSTTSIGDNVNMFGAFYGLTGGNTQVAGSSGFQGTIYDVGISSLSSALYGSTSTISPHPYTTTYYDKLLVTPNTVLPNYSTITNATATQSTNANGKYVTTYTGANTFYSGETIKVTNGTTGFQTDSATVVTATGTTFTIETSAKVTDTWSLRGTAVDAGTFYDDYGSAISSPRVLSWPTTTPCEFANLAPTSTAPVISGTIASGQTITGVLNGVSGTKSYQWVSSSTQSGTYSNISGATSSSYLITNSDIGNYLKLVVTNNGVSYLSSPTTQIPKLVPTLTWASTSNLSYGASVTPNATASVAGAFSYTSESSTVLISGTDSSTSITGNSTGSVKVTATFTPTDSATYATTTAIQTITVGKGTPLFTTIPNLSVTYGAPSSSIDTPTVTSSGVSGTWAYSSGTTSVVTVSGRALTFVNAGTSTITATFTPASTGVSANYNSASETFTVTVSKATPVITWSDTSTTFGATGFTTLPTISSGIAGTITYSTDSSTVLTVPTSSVVNSSGALTSTTGSFTVGSAGYANITATFTPSPTTNYNTVSKTIRVSVGAITPTFGAFGNVTKSFGSAAFTVTAPTVTNGGSGVISYTSDSSSVISLSGTNNSFATVGVVGTAVITATYTPSNTNNYNVVTTRMTVTVTAANPTLASISDITKTFGDAPFTILNPATNPTSLSSSGTYVYSTPDNSVATISGNTITIVGVGTATITATFTPGASDATKYNSASTTFRLQVVKQSASFAFSPITKTYGDSSFTPEITNTNSIPGNFSFSSASTGVITVSGSTLTIVGAGTSRITAVFTPTDLTSYDTVTVSILATVNKATPILTWSNVSTTFGTSGFSVYPTVSGGGAGVLTYSSNNSALRVPDSTTVGSDGTLLLTSGTYSLVRGGSAVVKSTFTPNSTQNYNVVDSSITVTINALTPTLSATPVTATYGDNPFTISAPTSNAAGTFTYSSNNPSVVTTSGTSGATLTVIGAGSTTITANFTPSDTATYQSASVAISISVAKANQQAISVVASSGKTATPLLLSFSGGTDASTATTYATSTSGCSISSVGSGLTATYYVTKTGAGGSCNVTATKSESANYNAVTSSAASIQFAGEQSVVSVSTPPTTARINDTYSASATMSAGSAIVTVDSASATVCSVSAGVVTFNAQGTCVLAFDNAGNSLFQASRFTQVIVVNTALQTITFTAISNKSYQANSFQALAISSAGLALAFSTTSDPRTCSVTSTGVVSIGALLGDCTISADQPGNLTYSPAATVSTTFSVIASVSSAPQISSITPWDTTVTVAWTAPSSTGGASITGYSVTSYQAGISTSHTCTTSSLSCVVTGLTNGLSYTFTVKATNSVGNSADSVQSVAVTPAGKADAVHNLVLHPDSGTVTASWDVIDTATMLNGGIFQNFNYFISSNPNDLGLPTVESSSASSSHAFTGLLNGTTYYVRVITVTNANNVEIIGQSADSVLTLPRAPSTAPALTLTNVISGSVTATWEAPSSDGGDPLNYQISATVNGNSSSCTYVAPYRTCSITSLNAGDHVYISVTAFNSYGSSPTATSDIYIASVPESATVNSISKIDSNHVLISWTNGRNGGSPLTWSTVKAYQNGTSIEKGICLVSAPATTCAMSFTSGNFFDFDYGLFITNSLGTSPESDRFHLEVSVPSAPVSLVATVTSSSFTVNFTPGSNGNLTITSYQYTLNAGETWTTFSANSNSLFLDQNITEQTTYLVSIRSVNELGAGESSTVLSLTTSAKPVVVVAPSPIVPAKPTCDSACQLAEDELRAKLLLETQLKIAIRSALDEASSQKPVKEIDDTSGAKIKINDLEVEIVSGGADGSVPGLDANANNFVPESVINALSNTLAFTSSSGAITFKPINGFTGKIVLPVITYISGIPTTLFTVVKVNPEAVVTASYSPMSVRRTSITWTQSASKIVGYEVTVNGVLLCTTVSATCAIPGLLGPKTNITIKALGNDQTSSEVSLVKYAPVAPVQVTKSNFATSSVILSAKDKKVLRIFAKRVQEQGFTRVICIGHTDSTGTSKINIPLSKMRAESQASFLRKYLPNVKVEIKGKGSSQPIATNSSKNGRAKNRRTEFFAW